MLGLTVALVVLVITLGSLVAAGLPLLVALLGVGVGLAGAVAFTVFTDLNTMTPALALMLGLAVGIDYALFIVNRHRGNILRGDDLHESIARSVATAGSAVVFAGTTVVIALAALVLSGLPILAQMGLVAAATVAVTVVVAVTVSPAVLALMKTRVVSRRGWRAHGFAAPGDVATRTGAGPPARGRARRLVRRPVTRHPWLTVVGVVALLGVMAIPVCRSGWAARRRQRGHRHQRAHGLHDDRRRVRPRRQRPDHRRGDPARAGHAPHRRRGARTPRPPSPRT